MVLKMSFEVYGKWMNILKTCITVSVGSEAVNAIKNGIVFSNDIKVQNVVNISQSRN